MYNIKVLGVKHIYMVNVFGVIMSIQDAHDYDFK